MLALLLPLDGDWYALEMRDVREVVPLPAVTPLPGAPEPVLGLFNLRGNVVALLDTAALLGVGTGAPATYAVVADAAGGPAALTATAMPRTGRLEDPAGPAELPGAVARFAASDGTVATLLDLEGLLEGLRR